MHTNEKATAETVASLHSAHSCMVERKFFEGSRRGAQSKPPCLGQLQRAARIALAKVVDPEARATLANIVGDAGRVLTLCGRGAR